MRCDSGQVLIWIIVRRPRRRLYNTEMASKRRRFKIERKISVILVPGKVHRAEREDPNIGHS
jgi:hypothetical protein